MLRLAKLLGLQFALLLALLIVFELALWWVVPVEIAPGRELTYSQNLPGLKQEVTFRTIGQGVRSASMRSFAKPEGSKRILCLGASTTQQATQNDEDTWCAILERLLRSNPTPGSHSIHSLSFGSGGQRAVDTARWLNSNYKIIKPDIVVTLLGVNDVSWSGGPGFQIRDVNSVIESQYTSLANKARIRCQELSQICRRLWSSWLRIRRMGKLRTGESLEWHSENLPSLRQEYRDLPYLATPVRNPDPLVEFRLATRWILEFLRARDVSVVVLGQPVLWKPEFTTKEFRQLWFRVATPQGFVRPSGSWLLNEMGRFNNAQKEEAEKIGAQYLDLDELIPKTVDYYFDDCHLTDKGSEYFAKMVFPIVRELLSQG